MDQKLPVPVILGNRAGRKAGGRPLGRRIYSSNPFLCTRKGAILAGTGMLIRSYRSFPPVTPLRLTSVALLRRILALPQSGWTQQYHLDS
jgi:hypothetical protein